MAFSRNFSTRLVTLMLTDQIGSTQFQRRSEE